MILPDPAGETFVENLPDNSGTLFRRRVDPGQNTVGNGAV